MYNPDKHHRKSIRIKNHAYDHGYYYVTICTENRACIFGKIKDGLMIQNDFGKIVQQEWLKTAEIRKNVKLHEFIIMPNHVHGILEINNDFHTVGAFCKTPDNQEKISGNYDLIRNVKAQQSIKNEYMSSISSKSGTLSIIIRLFKVSVSKQIHKMNYIGSIWQRNFWERIIRDEQSYQNISQYIIDNPLNWKNDELYV